MYFWIITAIGMIATSLIVVYESAGLDLWNAAGITAFWLGTLSLIFFGLGLAPVAARGFANNGALLFWGATASLSWGFYTFHGVDE